jgi:hypothetical protein
MAYLLIILNGSASYFLTVPDTVTLTIPNFWLNLSFIWIKYNLQSSDLPDLTSPRINTFGLQFIS